VRENRDALLGARLRAWSRCDWLAPPSRPPLADAQQGQFRQGSTPLGRLAYPELLARLRPAFRLTHRAAAVVRACWKTRTDARRRLAALSGFPQVRPVDKSAPFPGAVRYAPTRGPGSTPSPLLQTGDGWAFPWRVEGHAPRSPACRPGLPAIPAKGMAWLH
jgi:hypothetical protein